MGLEIKQSADYDLFERHEFNRDVKNTKNLENSMRKHGWIDAYPLHVTKNGSGKMKIKDGHTRFTAAQRLGIPVKYVVCKDSITLPEIGTATTPWKLQDYHASFVRSGNPNYVAVKDYCEKTGIGLTNAISMLAGESAGSNNKRDQYIAGRYKVGDRVHADQVGEIVTYLNNIGVSVATANLFVQALSRCCRVEQFQTHQFKQKAKRFKSLLEKQQNLDAYITMIEDIYNRASKSKIPLKHYAEEVARKRHLTFGKDS